MNSESNHPRNIWAVVAWQLRMGPRERWRPANRQLGRQIVCCVILLAATTASLRANGYSSLVVFGDSESDAGNVLAVSNWVLGYDYPPSPPYFDGRFSNGPVWVDRLAEHLGLPPAVASELGGTNYAWAGATTGSVPNFLGPPLLNMDAQVLQYFATYSPGADELFVLQGGLNDYWQGQTDPSAPVTYLANQISDLASAGARRFLFMNLEASVVPDDEFVAWVSSYHDSLAEELLNLQLTHVDISIGEFDRYGLEQRILADPASFGFTNVVDSACPDCWFPNPSPDLTTIVPNPDEYFVWDALELGHKTRSVHQLLGAGAFESLPAERIQIDIKPGSDPNSVNLKSQGVLPIAILSTEDFDALNVDVSTLRFGDSLLIRDGAMPVSPLRVTVEDVNGDGLDDVSLKVSVPDLVDQGALGAATFAGSLTGTTWDGSAIVGFDRMRVVGGSIKGVPEPSSWLLGICGWICLAVARRSRK